MKKVTLPEEKIERALDNLLRIERALWVIAVTLIWTPLGVIVFMLVCLKQYLEEQERK